MLNIRPLKLRLGLVFATLVLSVNLVLTEQAEAACVNTKVKSWDQLWIRSGPGKKNRKLGGIPAGACGVSIEGYCKWGRWCKVYYSGVTGWTKTSFLYTPPGKGQEFDN